MSGIKGFPSNQKLPLGSGITNEFTTVQPTDKYRNAMDVAARFAFRVGGNIPIASEAGTGNIDGITWVYHTATTAQVGDFVRFESGAAQYIEVAISKVETNRFMLGAKVDPAPASGDTFFIMRYATQRVESDGSQLTTVTPSPIAFVLDGVDTEVNEDTVTPANTIPLPTKVVDGAGVLVDFATQTTLAAADTKLGTANGHLAQIEADLTALEAKAATETTLLSVDAELVAANGHLTTIVAEVTSLDSKDFATETTLAAVAADIALIEAIDFATETTLGAVATDIALIEAKDFATETTLVSVDTHLTQMEADLTALEAKDFATQTTLAAVDTKVGSVIQTGAGETFVLVGGKDGGTNYRAIHVDVQGDVQVDVLSSALPTGAATEATLALLNAKDFATETTLAAVDAKLATLNSVTAPDVVFRLTHNYLTTPVSTAGYTQISASIPSAVRYLEIFDSSGEGVLLATGAAASEVDKLFIMPGGNGRIPVQIASGTRLTIKAFTNNATDGVLLINAFA